MKNLVKKIKAWWRRVTRRGGAPARPVQEELPEQVQGSTECRPTTPECRRRVHYSRAVRGRRGRF